MWNQCCSLNAKLTSMTGARLLGRCLILLSSTRLPGCQRAQRDGPCGALDAVTRWQQNPSAGQAADHLAVVVAGQGARLVAEPAGVAQHRIDVPPAWIVGMQGGSDVLDRAVGGKQMRRGEDRVFRAV